MGSAGRLRDLQVPQPFRQLPGTGCSDEEMPGRRRVEVSPDKVHTDDGDDLMRVSPQVQVPTNGVGRGQTEPTEEA